MFRLFRSTVFLMWLCGALAVGAITLGIQAVTLAAQVTTLSASAAATAIRHRKDVARAVARTKAKARLRRALVAVPIVGGGAMVYFERQDYQDWQAENPEGSFADYTCEVAALSAEVVDDVLQDLPETVRPSRDTALAMLPACTESGAEIAGQ